MVVVGLVVAMVIVVLCRKWNAEHVYEFKDTDSDSAVKFEATSNTLESKAYNETTTTGQEEHTYGNV